MKRLLLTTTVLTGVSLLPFAAHAANPDTWSGATSNAWETPGNWSNGAPTATSAVTISNLTNNPVQLNSNVSLNAGSGSNSASLTVGTGVAPGTPAVLNINLNDTLTMGTHTVTLAGGSITGLGTLSASTVSGFGTISSQIAGTTFNANATNGTTYGFPGGTFVNGTPGTALTLIGQNNLANDSFNVSAHGDFNFQGVNLSGTTTFNGVSTNLSGGPAGGNNTYGLFSFTGANSTLGAVNNANYEQVNVTGTKLSLNTFSLTNSWATNVPAFFVIGAGGTVDNAVGNSTLNGHMSTILTGGALTNSGGGTFTSAGMITGNGTVSGLTTISGGVTASGGQLTVNAAPGGTAIQSTSWQTGGGASDVLDLKGPFNYAGTGGFLNPGGATVQLDGATLNTTSGSGTIYGGHGTLNVASGVNTLAGAYIPNGSDGTTASVTVQNGATLNLQNTNTNYTAINAKNFTLAQGSVLNTGPGNNGLTLTGNFSTLQTDKVNGLSYNGTAGVGPDLSMIGGTALHPETLATAQTLEVGGINEGYTSAGFLDNFALHSLTIGPNAYVELVDNNANATASGWTSGSEALYLDGLFDGPGTDTLNLNGIYAYLQGYGQLQNGLYTDAQGDQINIIGAPLAAVPEPASLAVLGLGLTGLGFARRGRNHA